MTVKNITKIFVFSSLFIATGCSKKPEITFFCDKDKTGDYIIKWEVSPEKPSEKIMIYKSDNDSVFPDKPTLETNISNYVVRIPEQNLFIREFFKLRVKDTYSGIISNRFFRMNNIQNFRDAGGYFTNDGRQMKWGMIYRSGDFSSVSEKDLKVLNELNLKTIIDFREEGERITSPNLFKTQKTISIPIPFGNRGYIRERVLDGTFFREDAILFTQDMYRILVEYSADKYADFFDLLCDESNYPLVYHGYLGKDKTGLANYFLLRSLGVPEDVNVDDYVLSNNCINEQLVIGEAKFLPERMQEAATVFCKTNPAYLNYAKACMINISGSVDDYMTHKLRLTPEKREKLKEILLYK